MYELLVKGGTVIDPAQAIHEQRDIGISLGKIAALAPKITPSEAKRVIDARGKIVAPGLVDVHAHVADGIFRLAVAPDQAGILSGVTTVCDAGSTGCANFAGFRKFVIAQARTDVFCFLHIASTGLTIVPAIRSWCNIDPKSIRRIIDENRDVIKGIKLSAAEAVVENLGLEAVRLAKEVANEVGLPLMIHIGNHPAEVIPEETMSVFTQGMLSLLEEGDIVSHIFTWKQGGVVRRDGSVYPEVKEAMGRGVVLDVAEARTNWSFEIAKRAVQQGILPTTISTDIAKIHNPFAGLLATMSRFLAVGLTLSQVIEMTTINPARVLREDQRRGSLRVGMPADISLLEVREGDFLFSDGVPGETFKANLLLVPNLTLKSGVEIEPGSDFSRKDGYIGPTVIT